MSQRATKPTIRFVRPAKTQISLRIRAVWSESSLIEWAFYNLHSLTMITRGGSNKLQRTANTMESNKHNLPSLAYVFGQTGLSTLQGTLFANHQLVQHFQTITSESSGHIKTYLDTYFNELTLKAPRKTASENVVCLCRLLNILADFSNLFLHISKQCGPWSDCSLIWVHTVCKNDF